MSAADLATALRDELCAPLGVSRRALDVDPVSEAEAWAASGARELTGRADGAPLEVTGRPASATRAALAVAGAYLGVELPGVEVLGERAALGGLGRNAPFSVGGAFRCLSAGDGWLGLSLARNWDLDVLPALVRAPVIGDPWDAVAEWLRGLDVHSAFDRTIEYQLAASVVPARPLIERRPPIEIAVGGPRSGSARPTLIDLSALWAGPLCARLLGYSGVRVVKVESVDRLDGSRQGPPAFFELMHAGHELVQLDFTRDRAELHALVASADIVLEASRPRALAQLGIDAREHVADGAIWASITAYGRRAGDAARIGFGDDVAAGAGLVAWTARGPVPAGDALADPLAGVHAAAAIAVALHADRGCLLDVSMHDVSRRAAGSTECSSSRCVRENIRSTSSG